MFDESSAEPISPVSSPGRWDEEADILVIGAGGSGLAAAAKAAVGKASVIVTEKAEDIGGDTQWSTACCAWGTKAQKRNGITWNEDEILSMWTNIHNYRPDYRWLRHLMHKGAEFIDWTEGLGFEWDAAAGMLGTYHIRKGILEEHPFPGCQRETVDFLRKIAVDKGAKVLVNTRAVALVVAENGGVVGAKFESNGKTLFIKGKKGVILATGGMCNNREMIKKFMPTAYEGCGATYSMPTSTGDGIRLGLGVGADIAGYNSFGTFDGGIPYFEEGKGPWQRFLYNGDICLSRQPFINVNDLCERFTDEYAAGTAMGLFSKPIQGMNQPNHQYYVIFDKNYERDTVAFGMYACKHPLSPNEPGMDKFDESKTNCSRDWRVGVKKAIDAGMIKVADTIEELAVKLKLDPAKLSETIKTYNKYASKKEDPDYKKPSEFVLPIKEPPFYGIRQRALLFTNHCGLRINDKMQVLDKKLKVIPGLYAAYHTAGGDIGENVIGHGINSEVCLAYSSGMMAAECAIEGKK